MAISLRLGVALSNLPLSLIQMAKIRGYKVIGTTSKSKVNRVPSAHCFAETWR